MSWTDLVLPPAKTTKRSAVIMSCNKAGRFAQRLRLVVRDELLDGGLSWWRVGIAVRVQIGAGEHAGQMRVSVADAALAGPRHVLATSGGRRGRTTLVLPGYPALPPSAQTAAPDFDHGDGWLELSLPAWARPDRSAPSLAEAAPDDAARRGPGRPAKGFAMGAMAIPQKMRP